MCGSPSVKAHHWPVNPKTKVLHKHTGIFVSYVHERCEEVVQGPEYPEPCVFILQSTKRALRDEINLPVAVQANRQEIK